VSVKIKLLLRDILFLLFWVFTWLMLFFNMWDPGLFALLIFCTLGMGSLFVIRIPRKFHKFRVTDFVIIGTTIVFVIMSVIANWKIKDFQLIPKYGKLAYIVFVLFVAGTLTYKIYQDSKISEEKQEHQ